jgi:glycosyltransferase involved in cell wall biosynthesis
MTKVISISTDRKIFDESSPVRARQIEYGALFDELHIVVFTSVFSSLPTKIQIAPNVWVYGTKSWSKFLCISDAVKVASSVISRRDTGGDAHTSADNQSFVITTQDPFETGLVGRKLARKFKLPLHVQIHTDFLNSYFSTQSFLNRLRLKISKKVLMNADAVRVVSRRILESLQKNSHNISLKDGVIPFVLPIFVDVDKIEKTEIGDDPDADLRKKYPQFNFIVLVASRLTSEKNIPFAIEVFEKILSAYSKTGLVIVGSGPEKKRLENLVKKLGIGNNVVFEPWVSDLTPHYRTANVFLLTSNFEGYGLTLVEATANHCPIVSTDVGIARELTSPCAIGDVGCFFNKISDLIESPAQRENYVHEAESGLEKIIIRDKDEYLAKYKTSIESARDSHDQS